MTGGVFRYGYLFEKLCGGTVPDAVEYQGEAMALTYDTRLLLLMEKGGKTALLALGSLLICMIVAYLAGSMNFAVFLSKTLYHEDVRTRGSGNGGATNMLRNYGNKAGFLTLFCDILKAVLCVMLGKFLMGEGGGALAGLCCLLGHVFPVYYHFKGGKGVAVAAATILCLNPTVFLLEVILFVVIVASSRYISLGSVICAFFFPLLMNAFKSGARISPLSFTAYVLMAVIVIVMHRENIKRLLSRSENKFSFGKGKTK